MRYPEERFSPVILTLSVAKGKDLNMERQYYVYIATNRVNTVLYTGVTNNLEKRMYAHKQKLMPGFTARYNVNKLVYYASFPTALEAIAAEKKVKGWLRRKKIALIESMNAKWEDLSLLSP